jgi:hypothetical protein
LDRGPPQGLSRSAQAGTALDTYDRASGERVVDREGDGLCCVVAPVDAGLAAETADVLRILLARR